MEKGFGRFGLRRELLTALEDRGFDTPTPVQEQVLGATRAMMLRDGKITVPEMFNDAGEFLTLDELRRVDASAFE